MDNIISVQNLVKYFGDTVRVEVLHGISLDFERGVFTAIIGPSGSGKTSLLNIISLLEPPSSGSILIDGNDFSGGSINDYSAFRNNHIGFIFQFHYLLPEFTALENILMPFWIASGKPPENKVKRAWEIMEEIGIGKIAGKFPNQMSGGQQQRVAIARALINNPRIIFADEPTGNLDRETGEAVMEILKKMISELGTTLVMVTHDREIALKADRVVELVDGRICKSFIVREAGDGARAILEDRSCRI